MTGTSWSPLENNRSFADRRRRFPDALGRVLIRRKLPTKALSISTFSCPPCQALRLAARRSFAVIAAAFSFPSCAACRNPARFRMAYRAPGIGGRDNGRGSLRRPFNRLVTDWA